MLVVGTRPEAIKMAPLVHAFKQNHNWEVFVTATAQHRQMLDQVLQLFEIEPDFDLNLMKSRQDLYDISTGVLLGLRDVYKEVKPEWVFVHGDTTTSAMAALAAFYQQIPVAHVEAGLRTHQRYNPWPEEMNRQLTGRLASLHFAPTELSKMNLLGENVPENTIHITGNTVIDALFWVLQKLDKSPILRSEVLRTIEQKGYRISDAIRNHRRLVLITGHRRENFGEGMENICMAIQHLSRQFPEVDWVYPMHMNPNVRKPIAEIFGQQTPENVYFIEPLDYLPFVYLMNQAYLLLTDSGGIQEEGPSLGKPVLVMRTTTERPEAIEAGTVQLVGTDTRQLMDAVTRLLTDEKQYAAMSQAINPYGDGMASERIVQFLSKSE